ncbi:MAG TPA: anti-sigma factor, partial [Burkholderiales bacterium]|nr:anti-sigma factor [Burkholderiales bacterium]
LADVASSDQHTVKPWLSSRLDFSPPVSDLAAVGFPLLGGRVDYIGHRTVAALVYRHREHYIDVFIWPEREPSRVPLIGSESRQGYNVVRWTEGGLAFWAVSDINPAEMKAFVEAYAASKGS